MIFTQLIVDQVLPDKGEYTMNTLRVQQDISMGNNFPLTVIPVCELGHVRHVSYEKVNCFRILAPTSQACTK